MTGGGDEKTALQPDAFLTRLSQYPHSTAIIDIRLQYPIGRNIKCGHIWVCREAELTANDILSDLNFRAPSISDSIWNNTENHLNDNCFNYGDRIENNDNHYISSKPTIILVDEGGEGNDRASMLTSELNAIVKPPLSIRCVYLEGGFDRLGKEFPALLRNEPDFELNKLRLRLEQQLLLTATTQLNNRDNDCIMPSEILPNQLYLSGQTEARTHSTQFHVVIQLLATAVADNDSKDIMVDYPQGRIQYSFILQDHPRDAENGRLDKVLTKAHPLIDDALANGKRVLVHCKQGISRSATVVLSYLMRRRGMSLKDAYILVFSKRPIIKPNIGFHRYLSRMYPSCETFFSDGEFIMRSLMFQRQAAKLLV